jgi:hypothetical protein
MSRDTETLRWIVRGSEGVTLTEDMYMHDDDQEFFIWIRGSEGNVETLRQKLEDATVHPVEVDYLGRWIGPWRHYKLAPGIWSLSVQKDPGGWHICLGSHCWTTEVESR